MSRLIELAYDELNEDQRRVHGEIAAGPRGTVPPPHQVWLHSPGLCDTAQKLGVHCRYGSSLPPQLSELAILVTGRHWQADYEWWAHARIGRQAGIPDAVIEAVRRGEKPDFSGAIEHSEIVWTAAREMLETRRLSDATFAAADRALGRRGLTDLVGIVGYYCLISLTLNVFEIPTPDGVRPFADAV